jgi:hypothetical protein
VAHTQRGRCLHGRAGTHEERQGPYGELVSLIDFFSTNYLD